MQPNWKNRTLFKGDNIDILRGMNSGTVHLIATDPPFNKGRDFHATPDSLAAGASFQDRWSWDKDVHEEWTDKIQNDWPKVWNAIQGARQSYSGSMGAFLCFMATRLIEMRRILREDGSIYLHCDPTASHYFKELMDSIFGWKNFRNEIVWHYKNASRGKRQLAKSHDIILWYSMSGDYTFNRDAILVPFESGMTEWRYARGGQKGKEAPKGKTPDDVIELPALNTMSKERTGYPTQKPLELYRRIIKASSNEGDIVLDPFCGCATTCVAAEGLGRHWAGVDFWTRAETVLLKRMEQEGLYSERKRKGEQISFVYGDFHLVQEAPKRTDGGSDDAAPHFELEMQTQTKPLMSRAKMMAFLIEKEGMVCQGCDREFDDPRYLELDHKTPRSDGGSNDVENRVLLCGPCNRPKSNTLTLSGLRWENKKQGFMVREQDDKRPRLL